MPTANVSGAAAVTHQPPDRFKRAYLLTAFVSFLIILGLSLLVMVRHNRRNLFENAEIDASRIAEALLANEDETLRLTAEDGSRNLALARRDLPAFDKRIRVFLHPFGIVKIKLYNRDQRIIYCTDPKLIDKLDQGNQRLLRALGGKRVSVLKEKQSITDLTEEKRFDVDVIEVYVPMRDATGVIAGVFELYLDVSDIKRSFAEHLTTSLLMMTLSLLLLGGVSYLLIARESKELKSAYQQLEAMARLDALTGVYNRRYLLERAEELFTMISRSGEKLVPGVGIGLLMIDLDHFKQVNDSHGHLAGDEALRQAAQRVVEAVRPYDVLGRYGGEEFLLLIPTATRDEVNRVAQRVLKAINQLPIQAQGTALHLTASIGCAWSNSQHDTLDTALQRADEALYAAKREGRNRVVPVP